MKHGESWPDGSVIEMFGEQLRIRCNHGSSGTVEHLDGTFCTHKYFWEYQDEKAILISTPKT
ncbi:hypothetical protein [Vibrio sp. R78045]|uniref:hypothetical protein n=1 Tax=Vibrio sp. R78045 TaxID=3093868 RepID=UPI0036F3EE3A